MQISQIENILAHLLYAGTAKESNYTYTQSAGSRLLVSTQINLGFKPEPILSPLTTMDRNRVYTCDHALLLDDPASIIGSRGEVVLMTEDCAKWFCFKPILDRRGLLSAAPSDSAWIRMDYRKVTPAGNEDYIQSAIAWSGRHGRAFPVVRREHSAYLKRKDSGLDVDTDTFISCASLIEDSRAFWKVRVASGRAIELYADEESIHELCDLRDGPKTSSGRRSPLLHWVESHLRRTKKHSDGVEVERHLRGVHSFNVDGFDVSITQPRKGQKGSV